MSNSNESAASRRGFLAASGAAMVGLATVSDQNSAGENTPAANPAEGCADSNTVRTARMEIAEILPPPPGRLWRLAKQCGLNHVVGTWGRGRKLDGGREELPWSYPSLAALKETYEKGGFQFVETFHDDGKTDMAACMRAYRETGFDGVCRPDHVPTMEGDSNDNPGYSTIGRLFAIGYIRGLQQAVFS